MILAAAVCPHPPGLPPQVGLGLPELEPTRIAAADAVAALLESDPSRVVVIGPDEHPVDADESAAGSFAGFGVDLVVGGPGVRLPAAYAVGAWLLDEAGWDGPRRYTSATPNPGDRDVLLVLADADTAVGVSAPTHGDPRAAALESVITTALADADATTLAALDPETAREWQGTGVAPLRLLGELVTDETAKGASVTARLRSDETPFGVRYWVASWSLTR